MCCGIPGDDRESHTHTEREAAGSARCVCLSHPSASAHTPLSCTSPYKETPWVSTISVYMLRIWAQNTHKWGDKKKDEQLRTESHTSAWMMITQFKDIKIIKTGCSHPKQTEKWQNTHLFELLRQSHLHAGDKTFITVFDSETESRVTAEKAEIGSSHFLLTVQIFTGRQSLSAYLLANTRALHLKASQTYKLIHK